MSDALELPDPGEVPVFDGEHKSLGDGSRSTNSPSNVAWPFDDGPRCNELVLHQDVLLASKRNDHAARGLGIHVASQRRLARPNGSALLRAVAAPFEQELVGVYHGVELSREAKPYPYAERLLERFRKHCDLLGSWAGVPARRLKRRHSNVAKEKSEEVSEAFQEPRRDPGSSRRVIRCLIPSGPPRGRSALDQICVVR